MDEEIRPASAVGDDAAEPTTYAGSGPMHDEARRPADGSRASKRAVRWCRGQAARSEKLSVLVWPLLTVVLPDFDW